MQKFSMIDGLVIPKLTRATVEELVKARIKVVTYPTSIWGGMQEAVKRIAVFQDFVRENSDIATQVRTVAEIEALPDEGRVGIVMGWQNSDGFGSDVRNVPIFAQLGLRMVQLTFNSANAAGCAIYESRDSGLTDYGSELVSTLNTHYVGLDITHLSHRSAEEIIELSNRPVCFTHVCPKSLNPHMRNAPDKLLRAVADRGGVIGIAALAPYLPAVHADPMENYIEALLYAVNIAGKDHVGLGTDLCPGQGDEFYQYVSRAGGNGRILAHYSKPPFEPGLSTFEHMTRLPQTLEARKVSAEIIDKVLSKNWCRFYREVWEC